MVCRWGGVLCGSGSLSDEEEDDELDESEEACSGVPCAGLSPSGSSRGRRGFEGPDTKPGSLSGGGLASAVVSIGGGSSTCMWVAVLSSAAVGGAPRSTYLDPAMFYGLVGLLLGGYRRYEFPMKSPFGGVLGLLL